MKDIEVNSNAHGLVKFGKGISIAQAINVRIYFGDKFEEADPKEISKIVAVASMTEKGGQSQGSFHYSDFKDRELNLNDAELEDFCSQLLTNFPGLEENFMKEGETFNTQSDKFGTLWRRSKIDNDRRISEISKDNPTWKKAAEFVKQIEGSYHPTAEAVNKALSPQIVDTFKNLSKLADSARKIESVRQNMENDRLTKLELGKAKLEISEHGLNFQESIELKILDVLRDIRKQNDASIGALEANGKLIGNQIEQAKQSGTNAKILSYVAIGITILIGIANIYSDWKLSSSTSEILSAINDNIAENDPAELRTKADKVIQKLDDIFATLRSETDLDRKERSKLSEAIKQLRVAINRMTDVEEKVPTKK